MKAFFVVLLLCIMVSCSDKVNDDAIRARELILKSESAVTAYDFETAEKYFREFKDIENKYRGTGKYEAFEKAYWNCMTEGKN